MGIVAEQPPWIEVAQANAQDVMRQHIEAIKYAQLMEISRNVKLSGTASQQEAFKLTVSSLYGIITRASKDRLKVAMKEFEAELDRAVLNNQAYDKFKTWVAQNPDPLLP